MRRLAILCPGQGAQHRHMFDLACQDADTRAQLEQWDLPRYLGMPLQQVLDDSGLMFRNRYAQVLVVAAAMAAWTSLQRLLQPLSAEPVIIMGYSIGEITAYGVAGSLTANQALALAHTRAQLMDDARGSGPLQAQAMLSVTGLPLEALGRVLGQHGLYIAIVVAETSFIVGGLNSSMAAAAPAIQQLGGEANAIPVEIASHTPLMRPAAAAFRQELDATAFKEARVPVMSGAGAELVSSPAQARAHLLRQLTDSIHWSDCMDACAEQGVTVALELGPGATLSRMLQKRHPHIACRSLQDFRSLEGLAGWIDTACHD